MTREWFTAQELVGIPGMPTTDVGVRYKAKSEGWQKQKRLKGKGFEYHIDSLPLRTQASLGAVGASLLHIAEGQKSSFFVRWLARLLRPAVVEVIRREVRDA